MDLEEQFEKETGLSSTIPNYITSEGYYSQDYVEWLEAKINYTRSCATLKDKYEIVFEDWLKDHKFEQSNNGFHKNGIDYKVNEITWMYIQDVYNL